MPSVSKSQQRLMAQAYAVRKFLDTDGGDGTDPKDLDPDYRKEVLDLANEMSKKDLRDFAKTKHSGLPDRVGENSTVATVDSVNGMGEVRFPGPDTTGSGDLPTSFPTRKKRRFRRFSDFQKKSRS